MEQVKGKSDVEGHFYEKPTFQATLLVLLGFVFTVMAARLGSGKHPATGLTTLLYVLLSGIFQFLGARKFHSIGRAEPSLARASVRRLFGQAQKTILLLELVEGELENGTKESMKGVLGKVSVHLSYIYEELGQQIGDWKEFHGDALRDIES